MGDKMLQENIFNLPDPNFYDCFVERYHSNFQVLRLRLERIANTPPAAFRLAEMIFSDVLYFEGAFNWTGAGVNIAPMETCLQQLYRAGIFEANTLEEDIEETLATYYLFAIPTTSGGVVQFIANNQDFTLNIMG